MRTLKFVALLVIAGIFCAFLSPPVYAVDDERSVTADGGRVRMMRPEGEMRSMASSLSSSESNSEEEYVPGDVIVVLRNTGSAMSSGTYATYLSSAASSVGAQIAEVYYTLSEGRDGIFARLKVSEGTEEHAIDQLKARSDVIGAQLNYKYKIAAVTPNDTKYSSLWGMPAIKAPEAWSTKTGSNNVFVAVIDSGVDYTHADIANNFETNGYSGNYSSGTEAGDYSDANGHGTHVAGTIGAVGNNGLGVVGVNWTTKIISLRIFNASGGCSTSNILNAVDALKKLLDNNPNIKIASVNMSYGTGGIGYTTTPPEDRLTDPEYLAYKALNDTNRIVLCVAAGNCNSGVEIGSGKYTYPASFTGLSNMIVVANAQNTSDYAKSSSSNYSTQFVDVAAPGTNILSTAPQSSTLNSKYPSLVQVENGYKYITISGTSMATPHVAGAVALLAAVSPDADAPALKAAILKGANANYAKTYTANGFLDVSKSLEILSPNSKPQILTSTLSDGSVRTAYSATLSANGTNPITWSLYSGTLPPSFKVNSNGTITGAYSKSGTWTFTVKAQNSAGYDTKELTLKIKGVTPAFFTYHYLPAAVAGKPYSKQIDTTATGPAVWSVTGGALPAGLSLDASTGLISGIPTKAQVSLYSFTVKVENDAGSTTKAFSMYVDDPATSSDIVILPETMPYIRTNVPYYYKLKATGTAPIKWALVEGSLPSGITLNENGTISGRIPTQTWKGDYIKVKASNSTGSVTKHVLFRYDWYYGDFAADTLPDAVKGVSYSKNLYLNSNQNDNVSMISGSLPPGLILSSTGYLSGTPTETGTYTFTVVGGSTYYECHAKKTYTLKVGNNVVKPEIVPQLPDGIVGVPYNSAISHTGSTVTSWTRTGTTPAGLSWSNNDWLKGTPTTAGTYTFTVTAKNSAGTDTKNVSLKIRSTFANPPQIMTPSELPDAKVNEEYSFDIEAEGDTPMTWSVDEDELPNGLEFDVSSGKISGYPAITGTFNFTVKAVNSEGEDSKEFVIVVKADPPVITTATSLSPGYTDTKYSVELSASGTSPIEWDIVSGDLPDGLQLSSTGKIAGIPTVAGTYTFTVEASNEAGTCTKEFSITIMEILSESGKYKTAGYLKRSYSSYITVSGGTAPYTAEVYEGTIPTGLKLSVSGNKIYLKGTPKSVGTFNFGLKIKDSEGRTITTPEYTIKVTGPVLDPAKGALNDAYLNFPYSKIIKIKSGTTPYKATVLKNKLPDGLKLEVSGSKLKISGKPTKNGTFSFTIRVSDKNKSYADAAYSVKVTGPVFGSGNFTSPATVGTSYTGSIPVNGGTAPFEASLESGNLPDGLSLSYSDGKVILSGTPSKKGTFKFKVKVTDDNEGNSTSEQFTVVVNDGAITFDNPAKFKTPGYLRVKYTDSVTVSGGTAPYTWTKLSGTLPTGLALTYSGNKATLSGTPAKTGTFTFTLKVTDKNNRTASKAFTVKITGPSPIDYTFTDGYIGAKYEDYVVVNGTAPKSVKVKQGKLPDGLKLKISGKKIILSGTPTKVGTFTFTLRAIDKNKAWDEKKFTVVISYLPVSDPIKFKNGIVGAKYSDYITMLDGTEPFKYKITSGKKPNGLALSVSGSKIYLKGKPTKAGTFTFKLRITDDDGAYVEKEFTINITKATMSGTLPNGQVGVPYSATLTVSGGTQKYTWKVTGNSLPNGLKLSYSGAGTKATISGTPTKAKTYKFEITVTDKNGITDPITFKVTIAKASQTSKTSLYEDDENSVRSYTGNEESGRYETEISLPGNVTFSPEYYGGSDSTTFGFRTELKVSSDDVVSQGEGRDEDLVSVRANQPVTFIVGEWAREVSDEKVYVNDEVIEDIEIQEGIFTLPAEIVHDDFKVSVKASAGDSELESEELYISAE